MFLALGSTGGKATAAAAAEVAAEWEFLTSFYRDAGNAPPAFQEILHIVIQGLSDQRLMLTRYNFLSFGFVGFHADLAAIDRVAND